ncbi:mucoidy inhibitor MuiA family protein, partial [Myxococcota bacterium]|nr:mucoidy inhibitor MuiA family protein [Myxococcota bacterium]
MVTQIDATSTGQVTSLLAGRVSKVRVFIDRAAVTRARTLSEPVREVVFSPVPLDADPATLRASAELRGDDGASRVAARITGVVWTVIHAEPPESRRAEVRRAIEQADARLRALEDEEHAESKNAQLVAEYARIAAATLSKEWLDRDPAFDAWSTAFDHLRKRHTELALARATRQAERLELEKKKADLYAEELDLGHVEPLGHRVTVTLELPPGARGPLDVELTYLTKKAQWMPVYDARHLGPSGDVGERIVLTAVALVRQSTGEDWQGVELVATTARPPLSEPAPKLVPLHVTGHQGGAEREVVSTVRADARLHGATARAPAEPGLT